MNIKEECIKRLSKLEPIYVFKAKTYATSNGKHHRTTHHVFYMEKNVAKYAVISNPYWKRYGPSVIATLKEYSPLGLWQYKKDAIDEEECKHLYDLFYSRELDLPTLDLENMEYNA